MKLRGNLFVNKPPQTTGGVRLLNGEVRSFLYIP